MRLTVGLTGGIGSGKSFVADAFASRGVDVTDTDRLAHALTAPGEPGHSAVLATFGPSFRRTLTGGGEMITLTHRLAKTSEEPRVEE